MKPTTHMVALIAMAAAVWAVNAPATVASQALYHLGDSGVGTNKRPLDSSGQGRNFITDINGASVVVDSAMPAPGSTNDYIFNGSNHGAHQCCTTS